MVDLDLDCPASLDTLPLELLLAIFDLSKNDALLNTGKTCHRLNSIAIPIFLDRLKIRSPAESVLIRPLHDSYADELSGLTVDFSLVRITRLVCVLDYGQNKRVPDDLGRLSPIEGLKKNILRLHQLISRLKSIDSISIMFNSPAFWSLRLPMVEEFLAAFFQLIETVALKSCSSLQILHPDNVAVKPPYKFQRTPSNGLLQNLASVVRRPRDNDSELEGDGWRYQLQSSRYKQPPSLSPALNNGTKLRLLEIHSDFLLVPPFTLWTFSLMKYSPITSLSLSLPTNIKEDEFRCYVMPRIIGSLTGLQELRFAAHNDVFIAILIELLPELSQLRKLTFAASKYGVFPPPAYSSTNNLLPNLTTVTAYIDQATYLFGNVTCPALLALNIILEDNRGRPNYATIGVKLNALKIRFSEIGVAPIVSMCISGRQPMVPNSNVLADTINVEFAMVSRMTLELPIFDSVSDDMSLAQHLEYVMDWLEVFRGLKDITFTTRQPYSDSALLTEMIISEYPNIRNVNVVEYPAVFHYHWSNAPIDMRRSNSTLSDGPSFHEKSIEGCTCSNF